MEKDDSRCGAFNPRADNLVLDIIESPDASPDFLAVPGLVYGDALDRTPYFGIGEQWLVDTDEQPFYRAADATFFTAIQNGRAVGRASGVISHDHNRIWSTADAFLGSFECVEDYSVAESLLGAVDAWASKKGMHRVFATASPSANYSIGVQVEGFESAPVLMLNPNPRYYSHFLEQFGYQSVLDWLAYLIQAEGMRQRLLPLLIHLDTCRQQGINFHTLDANDLQSWIEPMRQIYNDAFEDEWGFIPMGADEFNVLMHKLLPFWVDGFSIMADREGEPVGFVLAVDSPGVAGAKQNPPHVLFLCVRRQYRKWHAGVGLALRFVEALIESGRSSAEFHIQEGNPYMQNLASSLGGKVVKRYSLFERWLS